jgi:ketosteroid isomerase-like protein
VSDEDRVRELVRVWNEGDLDVFLAQVDPDFEFTPDPKFPEQGPFSGEDLRKWMEDWWTTWGDAHLELDSVERVADVFVAKCRWVISGVKSGAHVPAEFSFAMWFGVDGRLRRVVAFFDHATAVEIAEAGG